MRRTHNAFTLIELLIVVAIIAILAAIAVPNFLEAQTRSKVSRCAADMRSIRTGLESYMVDNNKYPETDIGPNVAPTGMGMLRLTTPISYLTSVPRSPFDDHKIGNPGQPKYCNLMRSFVYVRALGIPGVTTNDAATGVDVNYRADRIFYFTQNASLAINLAQRDQGSWELKSVGPNNIDDFPLGNARPYDPTNGTISAGDVVAFGDTASIMHQK
jgi:type II secretion system protein G